MSSISKRLTNAELGSHNFGTFIINADDLVKAIQPFIAIGFTKSRLTAADIDLKVTERTTDKPHNTLNGLIKSGMKFFDAMAYLSMTVKERPALIIVEFDENNTPSTLVQIAESLAYLYFFLMTRGNIPTGGVSAQAGDVPGFLRTYMAFTLARDIYIKRISSFDLNKIEHGWIRGILINELPQQIRSRLALGIAGHRLFGPFRLYPCQDGITENFTIAYEAARAFILQGNSWDIHPLTRDMGILTKAGALNANLTNLILECFTKDHIDEMVASKLLYAFPIRQARAIEHRSWTPGTFGIMKSLIFPITEKLTVVSTTGESSKGKASV